MEYTKALEACICPYNLDIHVYLQYSDFIDNTWSVANITYIQMMSHRWSQGMIEATGAKGTESTTLYVWDMAKYSTIYTYTYRYISIHITNNVYIQVYRL